MGCAASKLDNEDTVRRCKERRRLMKDAVYARHHLASAHSDYLRSLRLTGFALSTFAQHQPLLSVSNNTPAAILLNTPPPSHAPHAPPHTPHAPPPPPDFSTSASPTISKLPHILSDSEPAPPPPRRKKPLQAKLPHILSESSLASTPRSQKPGGFFYPTAYQAVDSTYASTPSQASSMWNWENFYPPSPPDSEFFERKAQSRENLYRNDGGDAQHLDADDEETETERSEYDFFNPYGVKPKGGSVSSSVPGSGLGLGATGMKVNSRIPVGEETEREEVECSDWGDHDHYSTTSSSDAEEEVERGLGLGVRLRSRSELGSRSNYKSSSVRGESVVEEPVAEARPQREGLKYGSVSSKSEKSDDVRSMGSYRTGEISNMKIVVRHKDLKEIVDAIKENFEKAASAGDQVSEMLELGRAQLDKSFRQLKKTVYHSSSMLSTLSSTWTSKPPLAVKYRLDATSFNEPGASKSLCSTLERLLAWEKKLYEEVKAREGVKIEHEKKLSALQNQEYKGEDEAKIDKTKTSIKKLQSLMIVTSQAVTTTSTAIVGLRDSDLVPQLVELCHGFMYMWKSMHQYHEVQNNIVQQVRGLVNEASTGDATSELHRQATRDLESAVSAWHSSFCRLIKFQREFIRSIQGWFKLTLLPVTNDDTHSQAEPSDVYAFFDEWKLALDRVPDTVASEAIKSFINVVHVISVKQTEELKVKRRTDSASKELEKKASSLRNIEKKFYNSYSMVGIGLPDAGPDNGQVLDARDPLAEKKSELAACQRRVGDEMQRYAKAIEVTRSMTLNNLQTGLPGVFQALTSFSSLFTEALGTVCIRSYNIK